MPPTTTPASIISDAIASLTQAANVAVRCGTNSPGLMTDYFTTQLSKSEEQAQAELSRALSEARQARNQRDEALNSLKNIENEQVTHKQQFDTWKDAVSRDPSFGHSARSSCLLRMRDRLIHAHPIVAFS